VVDAYLGKEEYAPSGQASPRFRHSAVESSRTKHYLHTREKYYLGGVFLVRFGMRRSSRFKMSQTVAGHIMQMHP
jgi:hypothetical protein